MKTLYPCLVCVCRNLGGIVCCDFSGGLSSFLIKKKEKYRKILSLPLLLTLNGMS